MHCPGNQGLSPGQHTGVLGQRMTHICGPISDPLTNSKFDLLAKQKNPIYYPSQTKIERRRRHLVVINLHSLILAVIVLLASICIFRYYRSFISHNANHVLAPNKQKSEKGLTLGAEIHRLRRVRSRQLARCDSHRRCGRKGVCRPKGRLIATLSELLASMSISILHGTKG